MTALRVVVLGTGTDVGKTHVASALVGAWAARGRAVVGLKPIASGVHAQGGGDHIELARAAMFHVKHPSEGMDHVTRPLYAFRDAISPHLAARRSGMVISLDAIVSWTNALARDVTLVETAGGAFSPLGSGDDNLTLAARLGPAYRLLVAPDRLGVLHDVTSTVRLAAITGWPIHGVVLSAPGHPDGSTGTNADELARLNIAAVIAVYPRAPAWSPETRLAAEWTVQAIERHAESNGGRD